MRLAVLLAAVLSIAFAASLHAADAKRPNILWLISEDQGPELSCYGTPEVHTPNIDNLARQGVRYTRAFTTAPVCSASRSAFNTGMYQTTIGAHNHRSHRGENFPLPPGVKVLSHRMRDAGYFTANVVEMPAGVNVKGTGKTDWNFSIEGEPFQSKKWEDLKQNQPFYAQMNFSETHRTFNGPRKADPAKVVIPPYYPDHPVVREDWARYLDSAMELDRKIGLVLKQLGKDGLAENTIVFYFGDHGQAHVRGKQFCYDEGLRIPLVIRWAQGMTPPVNFKPGTVDEQLVAAIDFAPTVLSITGVGKPAGMQGRVFLGKDAEPEPRYVFGARDRCDETVFRFRTARDHQYRYIRNFTSDRPFLQDNQYKERQYPVWNLLKELDAQGKLNEVQKFLTAPTMPAEELYDVQADPYEVRNLAGDPKHAEVLARMRASTERWIEESGDQGKVLEPSEVVDKQSGYRVKKKQEAEKKAKQKNL